MGIRYTRWTKAAARKRNDDGTVLSVAAAGFCFVLPTSKEISNENDDADLFNEVEMTMREWRSRVDGLSVASRCNGWHHVAKWETRDCHMPTADTTAV